MGTRGSDLSSEAIRKGLATRYMGQSVVYVPSVSSTMDLALEEAHKGASEGTIVVADTQSAGRGRFNRPWVSPPGSALYLSVILRPKISWLGQLNMVATLAILQAVHLETGLAARIKWPNDVEIGGRKLAGVLIDSAMRGVEVEHAIVGIGLNTNLNPDEHPEIATIATSLSRELQTPVDRLPLLRAILLEMEQLYERVKAGDSLVLEWSKHVSTIGQSIRVSWPGDAAKKVMDEEGVAEGVGEDGSLLLRREDGSLTRLVAGEVSLRA